MKKLARIRGLDSLAAFKCIGYIFMVSVLLGNKKKDNNLLDISIQVCMKKKLVQCNSAIKWSDICVFKCLKKKS